MQNRFVKIICLLIFYFHVLTLIPSGLICPYTLTGHVKLHSLIQSCFSNWIMSLSFTPFLLSCVVSHTDAVQWARPVSWRAASLRVARSSWPAAPTATWNCGTWTSASCTPRRTPTTWESPAAARPHTSDQVSSESSKGQVTKTHSSSYIHLHADI